MVAIRAVAAGARSAGVGFLEYVKSGRDPVSVAIMAEVRCLNPHMMHILRHLS